MINILLQIMSSSSRMTMLQSLSAVLNHRPMRIFSSSTLMLALFVGTGTVNAQDNKGNVNIGDHVPSFTLKDQHGNDFNISDHIGQQKLVIFFYPKDESSICTKEACAFRDSYQAYKDAGALVIGINSGTVDSHQAFAKHHELPFILLSDPDNLVLKKFGIKGAIIMTGRETFVTDISGKVIMRFRGNFKSNEHSKQSLAALQSAK